MKGLNKVKLCIRRLQDVEKETEWLRGKLERIIESHRTCTEQLAAAVAEMEEGTVVRTEQEGLIQYIDEFIRLVFQPSRNKGIPIDEVLGSFYAYRQNSNIGSGVTAARLKTLLIEGLMQTHYTKAVTYKPTYLRRYLPFAPEKMAENMGLTMQELVDDSTIDWMSMVEYRPWWKMQDKSEITLNGERYYCMA